MSDSIYIGRQPIFTAKGEIYAYELLFRTKSSSQIIIEDDLISTIRVLINALNTIGTENLLGGKLGFINVDKRLVMSDMIEMVPPDEFVLEILEHCEIDKEFLDRILALKQKGYRFALDDFDLSKTMFARFEYLFEHLDIIKIDIPFIESKDDLLRLEEFPNQMMLAEKVESKKDFKTYTMLGFDLFQGYFFERPSTIESQNIDPSKSTVLQISSMLSNDEEIGKIIEIFQRDSKLTINLLRYINSAKFSFKHEISSISQAISIVGYQGLHSWLKMYLYTELSDDPLTKALYEHVEFRSFIMEEFLRELHKPHFIKKVSITAALSLIDAIFNAPLKEVLGPLGLNQKVTDAIFHHKGYLGAALLMAQSLETSNLRTIDKICKKVGISKAKPLQWQEQSYAHLAKVLQQKRED